MTFSVYDVCGYQVAVRDASLESTLRLMRDFEKSEHQWQKMMTGERYTIAGVTLMCLSIDRHYGFIELGADESKFYAVKPETCQACKYFIRTGKWGNVDYDCGGVCTAEKQLDYTHTGVYACKRFELGGESCDKSNDQ